MKSERRNVRCSNFFTCGWRGRRVAGDCSCYDEWAMSCSCTWGRCPKCGNKVITTNRLYPIRIKRIEKP